MKRLLLIFLICSSNMLLVGQELSPTVLNVAGTTMQNGSFGLEWSLGELAVSSVSGPNEILTQGFLQPQIEGPSFTTNPLDEYKVLIFPNPVQDDLNIETDYPDFTQIIVQDMLGRTALQIEFANTVQMANLPSGIFTITLADEYHALSKTYKVVKY